MWQDEYAEYFGESISHQLDTIASIDLMYRKGNRQGYLFSKTHFDIPFSVCTSSHWGKFSQV